MIPKSLEINDKNLLTCLEYIRVATEKLWDHPLLQYYTNHGPESFTKSN